MHPFTETRNAIQKGPCCDAWNDVGIVPLLFDCLCSLPQDLEVRWFKVPEGTHRLSIDLELRVISEALRENVCEQSQLVPAHGRDAASKAAMKNSA